MRIVWTRRYLRELAAIGDYIAKENPRAAARVVNDIHSMTKRLLSSNAFIGRKGEIKGTRELVIRRRPYIVAYRVGDDRIEILFVQHGARQCRKNLRILDRKDRQRTSANACVFSRDISVFYDELKIRGSANG